jgi:hypothetical protein
VRAYRAYETFQTEKERTDRIHELKKENLDITFNTNAELGDEFQSVYILEYSICQQK